MPPPPSPEPAGPAGPAEAPDAAGDAAGDGGAQPAPLSPRHQQALDEFVLLWGEMATYWGINRTMAQIHALLYAAERPLDTDEIMGRLKISRGNANMNLRALLDWNLARKTHQLGSRKDYYVAEKDVWKITTTIIEERQRREIKPVQAALSGVATGLRSGGGLAPDEAAFAARMDNLVAFLETFDEFTSALLPFLQGRHVDKVQRIVRFAAQLRPGRDAAP